MTRAYLRLDPHLVDKKADYPDGALVAFVACLCHADQQSERGRFRNERLLKVLLEKRARWVPYLIAHCDLIVLADGRIYVDGWDEWQEGDLTVPERMVRLRARKGVSPVTNGVTPSVTPSVTTPTVTIPSSVSGSDVAVNKSGGGAPSRAPYGNKSQPTTDESPSSGLWFGKGSHLGQHIGCMVCEVVPGSAAAAAKAKAQS